MRYCHARHLLALLVALALGGGNATVSAQDAGGNPLTGATAHRDIEYATVGEVSLKLDLYLPKMKPGVKPKLLVWIHGGGWHTGNKNPCPLLWFVARGYAVASISYRFSQVATFPAQIHDCKGAIRWLRAHATEYGYDAEAIGVGGASAGGHLVALLGTTGGIEELEGDVGGNLNQSSRVQAVLDLYGPTDFPSMEKQKHIEYVTSASALMLGTPIAINRQKAELASPLYHVTKDDAPILIIQGDADPLIFVPQSQSLHDAYVKEGVESTLEIIPGAGHGGIQFVDDVRRPMIEAFFDRHIAGKATGA